MRRRNRELKILIFVTLFFIVVGFGAVTLSVVLNGTALFGVNNADFVIIFTKSVIDGEDMSDTTISNDGKTITFTSTGTGYDNAIYTLIVKIDTIQYDQASNIW